MTGLIDTSDKENIVPAHHNNKQQQSASSSSFLLVNKQQPQHRPALRPTLQRLGGNRLAGAQRVQAATAVREDSSDDEEDEQHKEEQQQQPTHHQHQHQQHQQHQPPPPLALPSPPVPPPAAAQLNPLAARLAARRSQHLIPTTPAASPPLSFSAPPSQPPPPVPSAPTVTTPPTAILTPPPSSPLLPPSPPRHHQQPPPPPPPPPPSHPPPSSEPAPPPPPPPPSDPQQLTVCGVAYYVIKLIGRGATSSVYKVLSPSKQLYALKVIPLSSQQSAAAAGITTPQHLQTEVDCMQRLRGCTNCIQLVEYEHRPTHFSMLLELGSSDLNAYCEQRMHSQRLHPIRLRELWLSMLECVQSCHTVGILHRDLKPANFVFVDGKLKIIDFGIAAVCNDNSTAIVTDSITGTVNYMSPESLTGTADSSSSLYKQNRKSDVWSLGCILYQLVYARCPFADITNLVGKMRAICSQSHRIQYPTEGVGRDCLDVMRRCLERDVEKRASIAELLQHHFLNPD